MTAKEKKPSYSSHFDRTIQSAAALRNQGRRLLYKEDRRYGETNDSRILRKNAVADPSSERAVPETARC